MGSERPAGSSSWQRRWGLLVFATASMVFTWGTAYSYGVFLQPFSATFGLSRLVLSTVFSVQLFAFYILAGIVGLAVVLVPTRPLLIGTGLLTLVLAPAFYVVPGYAGLLVVFFLLGTALGTMYVVPVSIVPRWFDANRGLATGILFAGNGLGLQVMPPVWGWVIDRFGVRRGFFYVTLLTGVVFLLTALLCRRPPGAGIRERFDARALRAWLRRMAGQPAFWVVFVGIGSLFAWYYMLAAYAIDLFTGSGLSRAGATVAFGLVGGVSILSRIGTGTIADRFGFRPTIITTLVVTSLGCLLLFTRQWPIMYVAIFCLGIGLGGVAALYIPVLLDTFGPEKDTALVGIFNVSFGLFALSSPPVVTALAEVTGTHDASIAITWGMTVVGVLVIWRLMTPGRFVE